MSQLPPPPKERWEPPPSGLYSQRYAVPGVGTAWVKAGLGVGIPLLVAVVVIGLLLGHRGSSSTTPVATATTSASAPPASLPPESGSAGCSPAPCATAYGIVVTAAVVNRDLPDTLFLQPEAGLHGVALQLTFRNVSSKTEPTPRPDEFRLRDATGATHGSEGAFSLACGFWESVPLDAGQSQGPEPACFQAGGPAAAPLTVVWNTSPAAPDITIRLP